MMMQKCPLCGLADRSDSRCPCSEGDAEQLVGTLLNEKYSVQKLIGRGTWSRIYLALDNILNRLVAIKVLRTELRNEPISVARFTREAQALAVLNHPNIVTIFDFGVTAQEAPYLVLEQVEGLTLSSTLQKQTRLSLDVAKVVFLQCAAALASAHAKGVIHRDINPENIVISETPAGAHVKILDYGLCKMIYEEFDPKLTEKGIALATANYMSPEMTAGGVIDSRADIYSLGCVMYEALSGAPPFRADSYLDIVKNHLSKPVPQFDASLSIPGWMSAIVNRCLEKDPGKRFQSAEQLIEALKAGQHTAEPHAPGDAGQTLSSQALTMALGIACVILAVALLLLLIAKS